MKKTFSLITTLILIYSCGTPTYMAEFEENTAKAKAFFKLHEEENAEAMFEYLHPDIEWHMPVYGMDMGGV